MSEALLERAREFHGHICPFLALGLRASEIAMERLGIRKGREGETVGEEILAIVECNNCFLDGVQVATGCTLGNNCLIYLDAGKNAITLVKRVDWEGVRVYIDSEKLKENYFDRDALELFEKVRISKEGNERDFEKLRASWEEIGKRMMELPEDEFKIEKVHVRAIEKAPIFENTRCERCGEIAMKTRIRYAGGRTICLECLGKCNAVVGRGIVPNFEFPIVRG
ncbi:MAG: FmdE family protein [Candidatus Bathyarchaeia archaeon]